jgi:FAD/FMN-containing dehydrogenase
MSNSIISDLKEALGNEKVLTDAAVKERFYHIWKMEEDLEALAVILPVSTEDVSTCMKICHAHNQPVVVHGGLTNLVGSTETNPNEVVISMEKMDKVVEVDDSSRTLTVEAGCILENAQMAAAEKDLLLPLNFGAKGSAQIGGAIATNAGGLRVVKYGMTRNLVLGLEVVLADGTVLSSLKKIIKDNSAYDLKQLFVGSEGSLGIVTKAVMKLVETPKSRNAALVAVNDYHKVVKLLKHIDAGLGGKMSGFELMWNKFYDTMTDEKSVLRPPIASGFPYYVLVESHGGDHLADQETMERLLAEAFDNQWIEDGTIAQNSTDIEWFFKIRENVDEVVTRCTVDQHFDISLPIPLIGEVINQTIGRLKELDGVEHVFPFGHVADGNIHLIVGKSNDSDQLKNEINAIVYAPLQAIGGSVSAEHGIGLHKKAYLNLCRSENEIALMKTIKQSLDPKNILNRGKVLDI